MLTLASSPRPLVLPSSRARAGPTQVLDKQEGGLGGAIDVMGKLVRMSAHQERQRAVRERHVGLLHRLPREDIHTAHEEDLLAEAHSGPNATLGRFLGGGAYRFFFF